MLFSSLVFLTVFLPMVLFLYFFAPVQAKNHVLLIASIIFYSWGEPVYLFLMLFSAAFNYYMGLEIDSRSGKLRKTSLAFAVLVNLFILGFFKYFGFFMDTIGDLIGSEVSYTALPLPIGISFYTFQAMSYIIDVYRHTARVQRDFFRFALYLCLFPQLIAGPIVKYRDIESQLDRRPIHLQSMGEGSARFILGLAKKVILANALGDLHQQILTMDQEGGPTSVLLFWLGAVAYMLQIYFDFSGYSDMAIGLGRIFGFRFMENFQYPYISRSVTEFWRRWHISLSTWFLEYLYIPLGGNRVRTLRHIFNLLLVWTLTGLWHGASWNFVLWGVYYGLLLVLEKYVWGKGLEKLPACFQRLYALLVVLLGWVLFFSADLGSAIHYLTCLFGGGQVVVYNDTFLYLLKENLVLLLGAIAFCHPATYRTFQRITKRWSVLGIVVLLAVFVLCLAFLISTSYNPFLYFRF